MRRFGIHLSYWTTRWSDDLLPLLQKAKEAGFDGAELPLINPQEMQVHLQKYRSRAEQLGLALTCCTGLSPDADISHPDRPVRQRGMEHLMRCLEAAAEVESPLLAGVLHKGWSAPVPSTGLESYQKRSAETLRRVAEEAEKLKITLCVEVLNRYESFFMNTAGEGLEYIKQVESPAVKLLLDTYHMNIEEDDAAAAIRKCGSYLGHLHCSENNRKRPGAGALPWREIGAALEDTSYEGWLVMECFVQPGNEVGFATNTWRTLCGNLDRDARDGSAFLRALFSR